MKKKNKILKYIIIIFCIIINLIAIIKNNLYVKQNIIKIKEYYKLNNKGTLINKKYFKKNENPKISVISAIYNREKFILRFIRSIQNQHFYDIEILFIDDFSNDNSVNLIKENQKEDKRIILIKNNKNKGTLISRNIGIIKSKGEYIVIPDPDDILSKDILETCYCISKSYNFDMIRFNMYSDKPFVFGEISDNFKNIIFQPELRNYFIYGFGYLGLNDGIISNKFIKRIAFIRAINNINIFYLSQFMIYFEDGLLNFELYRNTKSLYLYKKIGYYYIFNKDSASSRINIKSYLKCFFIYLKFIIEKTKNNKYEKDIIFYYLNKYIIKNEILFNIEKEDIKYAEEVINQLFYNKFRTIKNKIKLKKIKNIIKKIKSKNHIT